MKADRLPISASQRFTAIAASAVLGIIAFSLIWIIHEAENDAYKAALRERVIRRASTLRSRLEQNLNARLLLVDGLAAYVKSGNALSPQTFQALAESMTFGRKDIRALELAPDAIIKFVYPLPGNEKAIGLDLRSLPDQAEAVERTIRDRQFVLAGPHALVQGGRGIIGRRPIFVSGSDGSERFWGLAIIIIDFDALISTADWHNEKDFIFALRGLDGRGAGGPVFLGPAKAFTSSPVLQDISLPNGSWQLAALPADGWSSDHPSAWLHRVIAVGVFLLTATGAYLFISIYFQRALIGKTLLESERKYRRIVETTNAISWELDLATWRFTYVSPHAVELLGYPLEEWSEENFWPEHLHPDDRNKALAYCIDKTKKGEDHNFEYRMLAADGNVVWLRDLVTVDSGGNGTGFLRGTMIDITKIKQAEEKVRVSLAEKEVLLQEIHHRVKNNLQVVSSMLSLQANAEKDGKIAAALLEGERRIRVMAQVHENIYQSDNLDSVNAEKYLEGIINDLKHNYQDRMKDVFIQIEADDISLDIDRAIPIGQIGSELVSNAFKHAFPIGRSGSIEVCLRRENNRIVFSVADDGVGMPEEMDIKSNKRLGLQLVNALAQKLGGEVIVNRENGTKVSIVFNGEGP